jgi:hypothetical protein
MTHSINLERVEQSELTGWNFRNLVRSCFLIEQEAVEKGTCRKVNKTSEEPKEEKQSPVAWSHCLALLGFREPWSTSCTLVSDLLP